MSIYSKIPDKIIRKLAKARGIKKLNGREISDIINAIIQEGHLNDLNHLVKEFAFTKNSCGLVIERPLTPFSDLVNTPEKFIKSLLESELIPHNFRQLMNWQTEFDDSIRICGIYQEGNSVFINTVKKKYHKVKNGWNNTTVSSYADFIPVAIHFENFLLEYRTTTTYLADVKEFILDLLFYEGDVKFDILTKVTSADANKIKVLLQAKYSSEEIALPATVGSFKLTSSRGAHDLENDALAIKFRDFLHENSLPSDDRMVVTCHLEEFEDRVTGVKFPVTFDINIKTGSIKFSSIVTQGVIDHVVDAIITVCFLEKLADRKLLEAGEAIS
ncbi:hypothetical protein C8Z91_04455 [Paenibacillus elgii]|uniref:Uncharacterized protein n=1 Tax=Paenibacillus elgii TaxID=189691 RepID=A0A2T6G887_9BACL|nr:hypothetical protein [Paenibacillus elgii]PUA40362.1 hypothetical protein C8Z91_04455 [Paenibacillus elgii]